MALLQRRGRLTYRALKRQFDLDDDYLEDVKAELLQGQRLAVDEDGTCHATPIQKLNDPVGSRFLLALRCPVCYEEWPGRQTRLQVVTSMHDYLKVSSQGG